MESGLAIFSVISYDLDFSSVFGRDKGLSEKEVKFFYIIIPWTPEKMITLSPSSMHNYRDKGHPESEKRSFWFDVFETSFPRESPETFGKGRILLSNNMKFTLASLL